MEDMNKNENNTENFENDNRAENTASNDSGADTPGAGGSGTDNSGAYNTGAGNYEAGASGANNSGTDNSGAYNTGAGNYGAGGSGVSDSGAYNTGAGNYEAGASGTDNSGAGNSGSYNPYEAASSEAAESSAQDDGSGADVSGSGEAEVDYSVAAGAQTTVGSGSSAEAGGAYGGSGSESYTSESGENSSYSDGTYGYGSDGSQTDGESYDAGSTGGTYGEGQNYNGTEGGGYSGYNDGYGNQQYNGGYYYNNGYGTGAGGQFAQAQRPPAKKKKGTAKKVLLAILIIALCGCAGYGGSTLANQKASSSQESTNVNISGDVSSLDAGSAIAEKVMPSVVGISTTEQTQIQSMFGTQSGTVEGVGTGIIVSSDGYILTNSHVISDGEVDTITVDLYDGNTYSGDVLWYDSSLDLAIVKIDATGLTAADLGDSDDVQIGDYALAIGNPLGLNYERSVTSGIISGLNRTITATDETTNQTNTMTGLIQTDAAINSGNSGGPLVNSSGEVIGINTAKASSSEGLGFAIPINTAVPIIKQIQENGTYTASYIGISGVDLSTIMENYQTNFNADEGVYIAQVFTDSPASDAGLKEGDIITKLNDTDISGMSALKTELVNYSPGDEITLTIERDKQTMTVKLTLGSESDANNTLQSGSSSSDSSGQSSQGSSSGQSQSGLGSLFNSYTN
ncbi:MAG: trypsin-like peptidase domain-containing protein [Anaerovoracaceae bacterium]|jgi:serine protease Do